MDIVVKGRNVAVPEHYRDHVNAKLTRLERYNRKAIRADVELFHERNPRQAKNCQRVEITLVGKGTPVRAEACAGDFYAALDAATTKLESRLRRMHDRRKVHYGQHNPTSVAEATAAMADRPVVMGAAAAEGRTTLLEAPQEASEYEVPGQRVAENGYEPGRIAREKEHSAKPMTVDQALYQMELVGHDFYLFSDADSGRPSVVYRRKGFDYGVIRLADAL
ncbi:ribosomal subunit interface protein [Saccharopolyspora antimicrobica]|uniref:Ribosome hibernation promoting factor n=2 Tax=Saccharopolyspora TaxID=1835 RepID=A0A1I5LDK0_9PSEU|nr:MULTISPECIES: ribosome-associated translation inhibitor RaiA [Saccharopolyspora]RKT85458.1 SSU ribosomal protein S30P /sigma 54 modulation protein [Saccharopolyspora antimicrobica]SEG98624.1 SSU ribosomal protein S30P /sigma 54 modulation protein [Saccharopolyspora kobensis]SFF27692.1 SSU ribosomal protein S30P /sigma 54 modulation protein [Saccharopolyspora kobensis]SFO95338.1 ribosomal subunit interface protein [Saccharopolyspora antimicrobica]